MIKDVFTTINGSWEPTDDYGSIPQWARDDYLKPFGAPDYFDDAGGDHHLFAAVIGDDGELLRLKDIVYWSDGFDVVNDPTYNEYIYRQTKYHSGWINIPIGPGSSYVPERGEMGPWCWMPTGGAETICGGGLPAKRHISTFVVWQEVRRDEINWPGDGGGENPYPSDGTNIYMPIVFGAPAPTVDDPSAASVPASQSEPVDEIGLIRQAAWNRLGFDYAGSTLRLMHEPMNWVHRKRRHLR